MDNNQILESHDVLSGRVPVASKTVLSWRPGTRSSLTRSEAFAGKIPQTCISTGLPLSRSQLKELSWREIAALVQVRATNDADLKLLAPYVLASEKPLEIPHLRVPFDDARGGFRGWRAIVSEVPELAIL